MPVPSSFARIAAGLALGLAVQACAAKEPSVVLKGKTFSIELAEDDASRAHGLMDRWRLDPQLLDEALRGIVLGPALQEAPPRHSR